MTRTAFLLAVAFGLVVPVGPADAHPAPFSYVDVHVDPPAIRAVLVVHAFDVAHELGLRSPEELFEPGVLGSHASAIAELLDGRLRAEAQGVSLKGSWSAPAPLRDRHSLRIEAEFGTDGVPGALRVGAWLFPYDPGHQTFVNVYEGGVLAEQAILGRGRPAFDHFTGTRQGVLAVVQKFVPAGVHHILIGPDHVLFLVGLLLLGGSLRRMVIVVSAFTLAHSVTLSLAALNVLNPPAAIIEPAIALSIVYVGIDNLLVKEGRDLRGWIAFAFGFIHGFGFAYVLREMDLPARALGWSLFSFNVGVELGQLLVVAAVGGALAALRTWSAEAGQRLAVAGSVAVATAGAFWFLERVFFQEGVI